MLKRNHELSTSHRSWVHLSSHEAGRLGDAMERPNHVRTQFRGWKWLAALCTCLVLMQFGLARPASGKGKPGGGGGSSPAVVYRVIPIESTVPGPTNALWGINSAGQAVGWITGAGERFPYVWTVGSGMVPLQSLISDEGWHLETVGAINELGQIVGFASEQTNPTAWAAYRLDLADGARLTILESGLINGYATKPGGFHTEIHINDCGDVVLGANGTIYLYPANYPIEDKIDLQYRGYTLGINCFREIIVSAYDDETGIARGNARLTLHADGGLSELLFPQPYSLNSMNELGTMVGMYRTNKPSVLYTFRYDDGDGEYILKDGRKTITSGAGSVSNTGINNHGDIGLASPIAIYTAENQYLDLRNLIHPDDALPSGSLRLMGIAERNDSDLPPAIMTAWQGSTEDGAIIKLGYYLLPEATGN